jgi:MFS family permease
MLFGLYAGVVADRFDNRKLVMATQAAQMVVSIGLTALVFSGWENLPAIYVLAFLGGSALVVDAPGRQSLTFQMVGRDELPNAVALNTGLFNGARIIGPAIAGVIIGLGGTGVCFLVNSITFLAVLTALA